MLTTDKVVETRDYYPFGLRMPGRSVTEGIPAVEDDTGHDLDGEGEQLCWLRGCTTPGHPKESFPTG